MNNIYVMSQFEALKFKLDEHPGEWAAVSITDPTQGLMFSQYFVDIFRLQFWDDGKEVPSEEEIKGLLKFVDSVLAKNQNLLIHCFMGVSRSYALAKFLDSFSKRKLVAYKDHNVGFFQALGKEYSPEKYPSIAAGDNEVFAYPRETAGMVKCGCKGYDSECIRCHGTGSHPKFWYL